MLLTIGFSAKLVACIFFLAHRRKIPGIEILVMTCAFPTLARK